MEILKVLGNPNKEYYRDESLILNYLELGIDIIVEKGYTVKKFILHTNYPEHPHFGFHNRCNYELKIELSPKVSFEQALGEVEEESKLTYSQLSTHSQQV